MNKKAYLFAKRVLDLCAAICGIAVTLPLWLIAVIGIEVSDPGPVFYRARRIGKDGREFVMLKFRSMRVPRNEAQKSEAGFRADADRIFPFGAFCRAMKIDELPQLWNILLGTMSVVGPRPAAKDQATIMRGGAMALASAVRPGLTGPAALYDYLYGDGITDEEEYGQKVLPARKALELYYPKHMSMGLDIKVIAYTAICILCRACGKMPQGIYRQLLSWAAEEIQQFHSVGA